MFLSTAHFASIDVALGITDVVKAILAGPIRNIKTPQFAHWVQGDGNCQDLKNIEGGG